MLRPFLLSAWLLVCVACATPFPIERLDLEQPMMAETVRERFGAPESIETLRGGVDSSWTYLNQAQIWPTTLFPPYLLSIPILAAWPGARWDRLYVEEWPLVLAFENEKLVSWFDNRTPQETSRTPGSQTFHEQMRDGRRPSVPPPSHQPAH